MEFQQQLSPTNWSFQRCFQGGVETRLGSHATHARDQLSAAAAAHPPNTNQKPAYNIGKMMGEYGESVNTKTILFPKMFMITETKKKKIVPSLEFGSRIASKDILNFPPFVLLESVVGGKFKLSLIAILEEKSNEGTFFFFFYSLFLFSCNFSQLLSLVVSLNRKCILFMHNSISSKAIVVSFNLFTLGYIYICNVSS